MSKVRSVDINRAFSDVQGAVSRYQPSIQRCPRCGRAMSTEHSATSKVRSCDINRAVSDVQGAVVRPRPSSRRCPKVRSATFLRSLSGRLRSLSQTLRSQRCQRPSATEHLVYRRTSCLVPRYYSGRSGTPHWHGRLKGGTGALLIITRSPLRISIGGGGTDLPSYYEQFGGFVIAGAIDRYVYCTVNRPFSPGIYLKYSKQESVERVDEVEHPIVREALRMMNFNTPQVEIATFADIPAGTGLGSSGSFAT